MTIKRTGQVRLSGKTVKRNDMELSREIAQNTKAGFKRIEGKDTGLTERPAGYELYPGE